jgi:hypothetical protein
MKLNMGSDTFVDVEIPLLWGKRAIVQDKQGRISVIDLGGSEAALEIVGDKPAPGVEYKLNIEGFSILEGDKELYSYNPEDKTLTGIELNLPDCQISPSEIRVGTNIFSGNTVVGSGVGIAISEDGLALGAPLPPSLAKLIVR